MAAHAHAHDDHADDDDHDHGHHGHSHAHGHAHAPHDDVRALTVALVLTAVGMTGEFVAVWLENSLALFADAWHLASDVGSLALALAAAQLGRRPRTARKTFGYRRLEVLAALANGLVLAVASIFVIREAWGRLAHPPPFHGLVVTAAGALTLVLNIVTALFLARRAKDRANVNVRAAFAHVLGDALGSAAAILAGLGAHFGGFLVLDPVLSLFVSALLLWNAWRLVSDTTHILMEGTPPGVDPVAVEHAIAAIPGVQSVHDVHVWSIGAGEPAITAHVVLAPGNHHGSAVSRAVCETLEKRFHVSHSTIQPEPGPPALVQLRTRRTP